MSTHHNNVVIDFDQLTPEQQQHLLKQAEAKNKEKEDKVKTERQEYKNLVHDRVMACVPILSSASQQLSLAKEFCFDEFKTLLQMKQELYNVTDDQKSHSFTNNDGTITIILGHHMIDGWDDTVTAGIAKVENVLDSLVTDEHSKSLVKAIRDLLARDGNGNLQYKRLGKLKKMADDMKHEELKDALNIIEDSYRPKRSTEFVKCLVQDEKGKKIPLALSISEAPFPEKEVAE
jgi:hypothetical protein